MSLNDLLGNLFGPLAFSDRKLKKLLEHGDIARARIDAIRVVYKGNSADEYYWGLTLADGSRVGVRQQLAPDKQGVARLGATVVVRALDGMAVIDWPATLEQAGHPDPGASIIGSPESEPPPRHTITDTRFDVKLLERGRRTTAVVVAEEPVFVMGMATQNVNLDLAVADTEPARRVTVKRALIPQYAKHLVAPGTELPVAVHQSKPDKLEIDWPAACLRAPAAG